MFIIVKFLFSVLNSNEFCLFYYQYASPAPLAISSIKILLRKKEYKKEWQEGILLGSASLFDDLGFWCLNVGLGSNQNSFKDCLGFNTWKPAKNCWKDNFKMKYHVLHHVQFTIPSQFFWQLKILYKTIILQINKLWLSCSKLKER